MRTPRTPYQVDDATATFLAVSPADLTDDELLQIGNAATVMAWQCKRELQKRQRPEPRRVTHLFAQRAGRVE